MSFYDSYCEQAFTAEPSGAWNYNRVSQVRPFGREDRRGENMFCPNCGSKIPDVVNFCPDCGVEMESIESTENWGFTEEYAGGYTENYTRGAFAGNRVGNGSGRAGAKKPELAGRQVVREMASSSQFLTAATAYSVSVVLGIFAASTSASGLVGYLNQLLSMFPDSAETAEFQMLLNRYGSGFSTAGFFSVLVTSLPSILTAAALWMIYTEGRKKRGRKFSTTGLTILRILSIISLAGVILLAVICLLGLMGILGFASNLTDGGSGDSTGAAVLIFMIVSLFFVALITYYWKIQKTLKTAEICVSEGVPVRAGSRYVGVILMIEAVLGIPGCILSPGIGKIQTLALVVANVCFSLMIFSFRNQTEHAVNKLKSGAADRLDNLPEKMSYGKDLLAAGQFVTEQQGENNPGWQTHGIDTGMFYGDDTVVEDPAGGMRPGLNNDGAAFSVSDGKTENPSPFPAVYDFEGAGRRNQNPFRNREKPVLPDSISEMDSYARYSFDNRLSDPEGTVLSDTVDYCENDFKKSESENLNAPDSKVNEEEWTILAREEQMRREREEQERLAREEQERLAREEQMRREREEQERLAREEQMRHEREEQERLAREEQMRREREEQERLAREEQERLAREEQMRHEREEQERLAREEQMRREREEQERLAREEQMRCTQEGEASNAQNILVVERQPAPETKLLYQTEKLTASLVHPEAHLTRLRNQQLVIMREPLLRIGRSLKDVDYVIHGNPAIGRHHADIIFREGHYYIVDRNSKNHVYVDGEMIPSSEEILLPDHAVVRFADEEFAFQVIC